LQGLPGTHLAPADRAAIERFLLDPVAWSSRHGGRTAAASR
jgi:orotate phosphoribosyltransferase